MEQKSKPSPKIIIETMLATGMTQAEAADHFGVSTRWIRTLQARYREGGINSLEPRSIRPRTNPRALNPSTVDRSLELHQNLTSMGRRTNHHGLHRQPRRHQNNRHRGKNRRLHTHRRKDLLQQERAKGQKVCLGSVIYSHCPVCLLKV